jgi:hypothetical protein
MVAKSKSTITEARRNRTLGTTGEAPDRGRTDPMSDRSSGSGHDSLQMCASRSPDPRDGQTVWLSVREAAARAGNSPRTVKRWIKEKYLQANRLPSPKGQGHLRVRLGDLEALIARGALS